LARVEKLESAAKQCDDEGETLKQELSSLELKLRHFEDNFQKITAATGLMDPDAIVNKFHFKGEIKLQLQQEIETKQGVVIEKKKELLEQKKVLEEVKANFRAGRWRDVEVLEEGNRGVDHKFKKKLQDLDKITAKLAFAQEGLAHLMKNISHALNISPEPEPERATNAMGLWSEEKATKLCAFLELHAESLCAEGDKYLAEKAEAERKADADRPKEAEKRFTMGNLALANMAVEKATLDSSRKTAEGGREQVDADVAAADSAATVAQPTAA
jgi:hypothetical protein